MFYLVTYLTTSHWWCSNAGIVGHWQLSTDAIVICNKLSLTYLLTYVWCCIVCMVHIQILINFLSCFGIYYVAWTSTSTKMALDCPPTWKMRYDHFTLTECYTALHTVDVNLQGKARVVYFPKIKYYRKFLKYWLKLGSINRVPVLAVVNCRVAGNTVWSHMACDFPQQWGDFANCYTRNYAFSLV